MVKLIKTLNRLLTRLSGILVMGSALAANAVETQTYSFQFDLLQDYQHAVILDYWYGNSRADRWIWSPDEFVKEGKTYTSENVFGAMLPGEALYVKWRITDTGKVYEDTVDLRRRLPKNIESHTIYLMIKGPHLYVYLVSPEPRSPNMPSNGPSMYAYRKVMTIYPDQPKP